jgi:hypothetical protein
MEFTCPYCKNSLIKDEAFHCSYYCKAHDGVTVKINFDYNNGEYNLYCTEIYNLKYCIIQYPDLDDMCIKRLYKYLDDYSYFLFSVPKDPNLTPENFEQKLKTYLNFQ